MFFWAIRPLLLKDMAFGICFFGSSSHVSWGHTKMGENLNTINCVPQSINKKGKETFATMENADKE